MKPIVVILAFFYRKVSFAGHRSQVTGHRSQLPEIIDVSIQQTSTTNVLLYDFNDKNDFNDEMG